jgi:hypothetical protein
MKALLIALAFALSATIVKAEPPDLSQKAIGPKVSCGAWISEGRVKSIKYSAM